jgi:CubicO group peptidase (beta-lactamase class C family)
VTKPLSAALLVITAIGGSASAADVLHASNSIPELQAAIESLLKETKTPGAAVAIVSPNKIEWMACLGKADVAANRPVTTNTLFRMGSVSKSFAAIAALQLQEAGKLKLTDTVRQWAPEVAFTNPWEATDPVRLVHLMEHTTGFEDMHFREYALDDPHEMPLRDALAYGAASRVCRWRPGTRMAYCNSGPAVLAAVIEKVSGERYEDYVREHIFKPLHMDSAGYFDTPVTRQQMATLYHRDGLTPYPYWHIAFRPTAAANASISDMANYVRFFLQRGSLDGTQLLAPGSIDRMETCETMPSARLGPVLNYGLFNYPIAEGPFVFHGHNGAVMGGVAKFEYLPEAGRGFVVLLNSGNFRTVFRIGELFRHYLTNGVAVPPLPPLATIPAELREHYQGHYQIISPTDQWSYGLERLVNVKTLTFTASGLSTDTYGMVRQQWVPLSDRLLRLKNEPLAQVALLPDADGKILVQYDLVTFKKIPAWRFWSQTVGAIVVGALVLSSLVFVPIWIWRKLFCKRNPSGPLLVRVLPVLSAVLHVTFILLIIRAFLGVITCTYIDDVSVGTPSKLTVSIMLASLAFPLAAVASLYVCYRERHTPMKRHVFWYSFLMATAVTAAGIYYGYWGLIGLRLWA